MFTVEADLLHTYITADALVTVEMYCDDRLVLSLEKEVMLKSGINYIDFEGVVKEVKLWYFNGMWVQNLYTANVRVSCQGKRWNISP
jgi:hypothetical protein